ncbi:MAG: ribosomal-processing cysteine protease Prp [Clostridia bacterium]|nr:ribosomal-processing cysteine protease Prp [Clostridia bacterium]
MIKVTVCQDNTGFLMTGHARYGKHGRDIVCAAASALAATCVNALESVADAAPLVTVRDGYMKAELPQGLAPERARDAVLIIRVFRQGIQDLCAEYGKHITMKIGGETHDTA